MSPRLNAFHGPAVWVFASILLKMKCSMRAPGHALAASGLSISLTSFYLSMTFFVGSSIDIPGIRSFCVYAAWSFLANYALQFLLFVPLLVMDDRRIGKKKNFCCPCCC